MVKRSAQYASPAELKVTLGDRMRRLRLARNLDQASVAARGGVSVSALRNLESGRGATVETLIRVLKSLDFLEGLDLLAPEPPLNPVSLLHSLKPQQRVRRPRRVAP